MMVRLKLDPVDERATEGRPDLGQDVDGVNDGASRLVRVLGGPEHEGLDLRCDVRRPGPAHTILFTGYLVKEILAKRDEVALDLESRGRGVVAAVAVLEGAVFRGHEGIEVVRRDELVLGAVDELDEAAELPVRAVVVDERQVRRDVLQEEDLGDAVEDIRSRRQAGIGGVLGQDRAGRSCGSC